MPQRRRRSVGRILGLVALVSVGGLVLLVGGAAAIAFVVLGPKDTVGQVAFDNELAIPPLADSTVDEQGRRVFELTAQEGETSFGGGTESTWGFNGPYLGPTLRAQRGEQVLVHVRNELDEATTVHWHGMHLPAEMDGGPHQPIAPGGTWSPTWTVDQPAATLWYHPHLHGRTREHVERGLAGMFILDDPAEERLGLPSSYGVDDLPAIVGDRDGEILVNGTVGPYAEVRTALVRLRLLNASSARVFRFTLDDGSPLVQIASDGGLLPEPHETTGVRLAPGERAEVLVRMEPGETRVLRSEDPDLGLNGFAERFQGGQDRFDVLQLRAAGQLEASNPVPGQLAPHNPDHAGDAADATVEREFLMAGRQINGETMRMDHVNEVVELGATEVWEVSSAGGEPHSFHVHDVQFRVLSVNGRRPGPELSGLKDTIYLEEDTTYQILLTFRDHADPTTPYMYHCHQLEHEDQGMMGQFVVVEPGDRPRLDTTGWDDHEVGPGRDGHSGH